VIRYERNTLILIIIFGGLGAWLFDTFGDLGEWLSLCCAIPPFGYYLFNIYKAHPKGGGNQ